MTPLMWILIIAIGLIVMGLVIFAIILFAKERKTHKDATKVINLMAQYSSGYATGIEKKVKKGDERSIIVFRPDDVDIVEAERQGKRVKVEEQKIAVKNNNIVNFSRQSLSGHRNFKIIYPPKGEYMSKKAQETFGKMLNEIEENRKNSKLIRAIRMRDRSTEEIVKEWQDLPTEVISKFKEALKDIDIDKDKKNRQYPGRNK